mgnify:CR=1 FL=1
MTDEILQAWSGMKVREYKHFKDLKKQNLRDNMTNLELVLNMLAEATTTEISKKKQPKGFFESREIAKQGGQIAGTARKGIEQKTGEAIVSRKNAGDMLSGARRRKGGNRIKEVKWA